MSEVPLYLLCGAKRLRVGLERDLGARQRFRQRPHAPAARDRLRVGWPQGFLMRSHEERRCSNLGPTRSRISPSIL